LLTHDYKGFAFIGARLSEPHLALLLDEMCVCLYGMSSERAKCMYIRACAGQPNTCLA